MAKRKTKHNNRKLLNTFVLLCSCAMICVGCLLVVYYFNIDKQTVAVSAENTSVSSTEHKETIEINPNSEYSSETISPVRYGDNEQSSSPAVTVPDDLTITLKFGKKTEVITADIIRSWINPDSSKGKWNDDAILSYARKLCEQYTNYDYYITFTDHNGEERSVVNKSIGWILSDTKTAEQLKKYAAAQKTVVLDLTDRSKSSNKWWTRVAAEYDYETMRGDTFAEVSIDSQHMWVVKNGSVILESDIITGNPNTNHDTPVGGYLVSSKSSPATLFGPGYETEVSYWVCFNFDIGFHDAVWQYYFGGDCYLYNGSHGCVNLPLDFAAALYDASYVNMPVYVY